MAVFLVRRVSGYVPNINIAHSGEMVERHPNRSALHRCIMHYGYLCIALASHLANNSDAASFTGRRE